VSGRIVFAPTPDCTHGCVGKPLAENLAPGTVWQCDGCEKQWVVIRGSQYNETYSAWRDANSPTPQGESRGPRVRPSCGRYAAHGPHQYSDIGTDTLPCHGSTGEVTP
jgi:hypothetical protein